LNLGSRGITDSITLKALLTGFHEILEPGVVSAGADALPAANVSNGRIAAETFQHDADLFLSGELSASDALDINNKLLCFFASGFSLPEPVRDSLGHGPLLSSK